MTDISGPKTFLELVWKKETPEDSNSIEMDLSILEDEPPKIGKDARAWVVGKQITSGSRMAMEILDWQQKSL